MRRLYDSPAWRASRSASCGFITTSPTDESRRNARTFACASRLCHFLFIPRIARSSKKTRLTSMVCFLDTREKTRTNKVRGTRFEVLFRIEKLEITKAFFYHFGRATTRRAPPHSYHDTFHDNAKIFFR